jgi:hypothetical protein
MLQKQKLDAVNTSLIEQFVRFPKNAALSLYKLLCPKVSINILKIIEVDIKYQSYQNGRNNRKENTLFFGRVTIK